MNSPLIKKIPNRFPRKKSEVNLNDNHIASATEKNKNHADKHASIAQDPKTNSAHAASAAANDIEKGNEQSKKTNSATSAPVNNKSQTDGQFKQTDSVHAAVGFSNHESTSHENNSHENGIGRTSSQNANDVDESTDSNWKQKAKTAAKVVAVGTLGTLAFTGVTAGKFQ